MDKKLDLESRLERVERQLQTWKRFALLSCALLVMMLVGWAPFDEGAAPETDVPSGESNLQLKDVLPDRPVERQELDVRRLRIVDEKGDPRIDLGITEIGPTIRIFDAQEKPRVTLFVNEDGPGVSLSDDKAQTRVGLSVLNDDSELRLIDAQGHTWAVLMEQEQKRMFALASDRQSSRMGVLLSDGAATLTVAGGGGKQRVTTRAGESGPELTMTDRDGSTVLQQP